MQGLALPSRSALEDNILQQNRPQSLSAVHAALDLGDTDAGELGLPGRTTSASSASIPDRPEVASARPGRIGKVKSRTGGKRTATFT